MTWYNKFKIIFVIISMLDDVFCIVSIYTYNNRKCANFTKPHQYHLPECGTNYLKTRRHYHSTNHEKIIICSCNQDSENYF